MIHLDKDPTLKTLLIQEAMQARGHYTGALDNWWGTQSEAALKKCQTEIKETLGLPVAPAVSADGIALIQHFESCLKPLGNGMFAAYADPAHGWAVPTIGWGTVQYEDETESLALVAGGIALLLALIALSSFLAN